MSRHVLPALALLLLAPALVACGGDDDSDDDSRGGSGGDALAEAFGVMPASTTSVELVDRVAVAERLDLDGADVDDYLEAAADDPVGGTDLLPFIELMAESGAFDERDVNWSVSAALDVDQGGITAYRLADGFDLGDLADDLLDKGYTEGSVDGRRQFEAEPELFDETGTFGGAYPGAWNRVTLDDDAHLVLTGFNAAAVLDVLDGDADALDADRFSDVLGDDTDDLEYADLRSPASCIEADRMLGPDATPAETAELQDLIEDRVGDLGRPAATSLVYTADGDDVVATGRLRFADDDEAERDLPARETYLEEGLLLRGQRPFSTYGSADLSRDGPVVVLDLDLELPVVAKQLESDGPFGCGPA